MPEAKKWKFNERDAKLLTDFLHSQDQWAADERQRCLDEYQRSGDKWCLGQLEHWTRFRGTIRYLINNVHFRQAHPRPDDYKKQV